MAFQDTDESKLPMLNEDEDENSISFATSPPTQGRHRTCSMLLIGLVSSVLLALSVIWAFQSIFLPTHTNPQRILKSPCGNSSSEALARGCHFDVLSFCWVPDECIDRDLTEKFRKAGPWIFYTDQNKTTSVTEEQFGSDMQHVYLTNKLHKTHCAYNILRFHKALTEGRMVHKEDVLTHTEHCSQVLTRINDPDDIEVRAKIQYPDCGHFSKDFPGKAKEGVQKHHNGHLNMV
ncbi:hypothetical protein EAF00_011373 [Botryotinia globosa]|nr:hypothetical protein EAF00_011373 [Botryotinia globosa]